MAGAFNHLTHCFVKYSRTTGSGLSLFCYQHPVACCVVAVWLAVFLDVSHKGTLLDTAACIQRYPSLQNVLQQQQQQGQHPSIGSGAHVVAVWSNMARTMVLAHQRRGESDYVAHWLYQLLALDSRAEEWAHAMQ